MLGGNLKYGSTTAGPLIQFVDQLIALPSAMVTKDRKPRESYVEFLNRAISETTKGRQDLPSMVGSLAGVPGSRYAKTVSMIRERGGGWDDALLGRYPEKRKGTLRTRATRGDGGRQRATR